LDKAFYLCEKELKNIKNIKIKDVNDLCFNLRQWLEQDEKTDICFTGLPVNQMLNDLKEIYIYMEAAGGVVKNKTGKYLFIKRFGIWDLPKGKIEKGETPKTAAVREVEEETGVTDLRIIKHLTNSWHIYPLRDNYVLKKTYWYLMETEFGGELIPQTKEDITEVKWLDKTNAVKALESSYRSLRESLGVFF